MNRRTMRRVVAIIAMIAAAGGRPGGAQDNPAVEHARRVLELLRQEKVDEVAKEFSPQVAAVLTAPRLRDVWTTLGQQAGPFVSVIDQDVRSAGSGVTAVILGCQFERTSLNFLVAFDAEGRIAGLRFTPRLAAAQSEPPPASSHFTEESVTVGAGEWALPGTLSMPVDTVDAAVVLVHGSGPNDRDETVGSNRPFRDLAWGLADRGVAVLRYEKRTRQYAAKVAALGNFTVREEVIDDALAATALLRGRARIDPKRIFILGHSLGGSLAPRIAAEDRSLGGLIILAGATRPFAEVAREQLAYVASLSPGAPATTTPDEGLKTILSAAPDSYWKDLNAYAPAEAASTLELPMLILQGERDYQVTTADLDGWRKALAGRPGVTIRSYPTLNHLFIPGEGKSSPSEYTRPGRIPDFVLDDIAGWVKQVGR